ARQVVFHVGAQPLRLFSTPQSFRRFLDLDLLRVQVERCLREQLELRRARRPLASALLLVALERLPERLAVLLLFDDRPAAEALEERPPLCDQLILRKLNEHFLPPARRQRSIGNAHISLSPPSTGPSLSRGYRSDHFHWNARVPRGLIRIASTRTRRIECSRPRAGGRAAFRTPKTEAAIDFDGCGFAVD